MTVTISGHVCVLADNVRETSTTSGTGPYGLNGAAPGAVSFATGIGNGNKTPYRAQSGTSWEIGVGTVTTVPPTLARTLIVRSSNSNNAVSWTGTTIDIFVVAPAALLDQIAGGAVQVSGPEITAGSGTSVRGWSPANVVSAVEQHAPVVSLPAQVSGAEITAGTVTSLRSWSPANVVSAIDQHAPIAAAAFINTKVTTFTSSGTFTTDAKCIVARVRMVGGGGAGGDAASTGPNSAAEGGGGGGGEYAEGRFTAATLGASKTVTIGQGGSGVSNTGGGTTSFGSLLSAGGGDAGGEGTANATTDFNATAGDGGTGGTGGYLRFRGGDGGRGIVRTNGTNGIVGLQGHGGTSHFAGQSTPSVGGAGNSGHTYGGGGAGASVSANSATQNGGNGADGVVIVEEFLST